MLSSCEYCEFEAEQNETLIVHMKENHELSCDQCETKFVTSDSLEMHYQYKHFKNKIEPDQINLNKTQKENISNKTKSACAWCKTNNGEKTCIQCVKKCCNPCISNVNYISKDNMETVIKKGIIGKKLETNEFICKPCFKERCKVVVTKNGL